MKNQKSDANVWAKERAQSKCDQCFHPRSNGILPPKKENPAICFNNGEDEVSEATAAPAPDRASLAALSRASIQFTGAISRPNTLGLPRAETPAGSAPSTPGGNSPQLFYRSVSQYNEGLKNDLHFTEYLEPLLEQIHKMW